MNFIQGASANIVVDLNKAIWYGLIMNICTLISGFLKLCISNTNKYKPYAKRSDINRKYINPSNQASHDIKKSKYT